MTHPPTRRSALAAACLALFPRLAWARARDEEADVEAVIRRAKEVGLADFGVSRNEEYVAVGDAPVAFRDEALEILLGHSRDYLKHMADKKFAVKKPDSRMVLVVLSGRPAFRGFLGVEEREEVGGYFDLISNHLLFFDNRNGGAGPEPARANTLVLFHEATHQLCFNTGLLDRKGDIPLAVAEGLANYGETRTPSGRGKVGGLNRRRLDPLIVGRKRGATLPPVEAMIANDEYFRDPATNQIGYSECWLLVYYLMRTPARCASFRSYLEAIRPRRDDRKRLGDWREHFGEGPKLDRELAAFLRKLS